MERQIGSSSCAIVCVIVFARGTPEECVFGLAHKGATHVANKLLATATLAHWSHPTTFVTVTLVSAMSPRPLRRKRPVPPLRVTQLLEPALEDARLTDALGPLKDVCASLAVPSIEVLAQACQEGNRQFRPLSQHHRGLCLLLPASSRCRLAELLQQGKASPLLLCTLGRF
jgi:hypothetical protein